MSDEKWVVVECYSDWSGAEEVYGIFPSKLEAEDYIANDMGWKASYCQVFRIKRPVTEMWA